MGSASRSLTPHSSLAAWLGLSALLATVGCIGQEDARIPGEPLGTFRVNASLQESSCGSGVLGAPAEWSFELQLSRDEDHLYWLNGEAPVEGSLDAAGEFSIQSGSQVILAEPSQTSAGCAVDRADLASGSLGEDPEPTALSGTLRYDYQVSEGASCVEYFGIEGGFTQLPCRVDYTFEASRIRAPE